MHVRMIHEIWLLRSFIIVVSLLREMGEPNWGNCFGDFLFGVYCFFFNSSWNHVDRSIDGKGCIRRKRIVELFMDNG